MRRNSMFFKWMATLPMPLLAAPWVACGWLLSSATGARATAIETIPVEDKRVYLPAPGVKTFPSRVTFREAGGLNPSISVSIRRNFEIVQVQQVGPAVRVFNVYPVRIHVPDPVDPNAPIDFFFFMATNDDTASTTGLQGLPGDWVVQQTFLEGTSGTQYAAQLTPMNDLANLPTMSSNLTMIEWDLSMFQQTMGNFFLAQVTLPHAYELLPAPPVFQDVLGFEDDVDIVAAPDGEFLVIPEESADGSQARVTVVDLDAATGEPLGEAFGIDVLGFEHGVDLFVTPFLAGTYGILIPTESANELQAEVILLFVDAAGALISEARYELGNLGFREDVDGLWESYDNRTAFFPLESKDGGVRGLIAIDIDPSDGEAGDCTLLSTDGRAGCDANIAIDWLPGLAECVDPIAYRMDDRLRVALPVASATDADLLFVDWDPSISPPEWLDVAGQPISVKDVNAGGAHPTGFPGWERDVDLALFVAGSCGLAGRSILVPVEGPGDDGDLYLLDENGNAQWVLTESVATLGLAVPGYEKGVDVLPLCDLPIVNPHRLVVPLENAAGMDADLWFVDLPTGALLARVEDPLVNPDLTLPGFEMGIDVVRWTETELLVPVERIDGLGGLRVIDIAGLMIDHVDFLDSGFEKSTDVIVDAGASPDPVCFVPVMSTDGTDHDVLILRSPPSIAGESLEELNPEVGVGDLVRDVDLGLITRPVGGDEWLYVPEEDDTGANARLRFDLVPQDGRYMVMATDPLGTVPASLYYVRVSTGLVDFLFDDLLGLESGLDMASRFGPVTPGNPPTFPPLGSDFDSDLTFIWAPSTTDVFDGGLRSGVHIRRANPFTPGGRLHFELPVPGTTTVTIYNVAGRKVRELSSGHRMSGWHSLHWDGLDARRIAVPAGVYFVRVQEGRRAATSKFVVVR